MRVVVVTGAIRPEGASVLAELGCDVRVLSPRAELELPGVGRDAVEVVLVETPDDAELARDVVRRVRATGARVSVVLALSPAQLARLDPAWGHDDFVLYPYVPPELYARLRALEWRASEFAQPERVKIGDVVIDVPGHTVTVAGRAVSLAEREFALLLDLARERGRVRDRAALLRDVWGLRRVAPTRTLDVHIQRLRAKLGRSAVIETVRGVGYVLRGENTPGAAKPVELAMARRRA